MKKVTVHWNAGTYTPNAVDRASYHGGTDGDGNFWLGDKPPEANKSPLGSDYVRHTGAGNSDNIGHCICGMGGSEVKERPLNMGKYPIKDSQLQAACEQIYTNWLVPYDLTAEDVQTHAEFHKRTGKGNYKWDITCMEGMTETVEPEVIGDIIRSKIRTIESAVAMSRKPPRKLHETKTVKAAGLLQGVNATGAAAIFGSLSDLDPMVAIALIVCLIASVALGAYFYFNRRADFRSGWR